jgi:hypothetical protein
MRDIAAVRWTTFALLLLVPLAALLVEGALTDGPVLTNTALAALPLAWVACIAGFAWIKRTHAGDSAGQ